VLKALPMVLFVCDGCEFLDAYPPEVECRVLHVSGLKRLFRVGALTANMETIWMIVLVVAFVA
jgi:hypothetical protein